MDAELRFLNKTLKEHLGFSLQFTVKYEKKNIYEKKIAKQKEPELEDLKNYWCIHIAKHEKPVLKRALRVWMSNCLMKNL